MSELARTPSPPYVAVLFTSRRSEREADQYGRMAARMEELAREQKGYLGIESARDDEGFGITVSYWRDLKSAREWKANAEHLVAQALGKERWYLDYRVRLAIVERDYGPAGEGT